LISITHAINFVHQSNEKLNLSSLLYQENYIESEELDYDEEVEVKGKLEEKETRINNKAFIFDRYLKV
jgi:hypothetical protein